MYLALASLQRFYVVFLGCVFLVKQALFSRSDIVSDDRVLAKPQTKVLHKQVRAVLTTVYRHVKNMISQTKI